MKNTLSVLSLFLLFLSAQQAHTHMPQAPSDLVAMSVGNSIRLSWTAPPNPGEIAGYTIYRCEEGETPCTPTLIKWVAHPGDTPPPPTSYTDGGVAVVDGVMIGLVAGTTYRYQVTASYTMDYHESFRSDAVTVLAEGGADPAPEPEPESSMYPPAPPTGLTATPGVDSIDLSWNAPSDDIAGYSIYRCEEGETPCRPEWIAWVANEGDVPPAPTSYTDGGAAVVDGVMVGLVAGTTYRYAVTSNNVDSAGDYYESDDRYEEVTALAAGDTEPEPEPEPKPEPEPEPEPAKPAVTPEEKQAALEDVSATMGRNMLSGIVTTIGNRFTAAPNASKFSLAGRQMTLDDLAARMSSETGRDFPALHGNNAGSVLADGFGAAQVAPHNHERTISWQRLLDGSSFLVSLDGGVNSRQLNLWGSGDVQSFDGDSHDGDIYTGYLGADLWLRQNMLAGVSVSHSVGEAEYVIDDQQGKLDTELTTVLPYTRFLLSDRTEAWAVLGAGWGEASHHDGSVREAAALSVVLGALGGRRMFGPDSGGMNWAARADAAFIRLWTDEGLQTVDELAANASQLRLGLEASYPFILENAAQVRPFMDAGVRYDGGDGNNTGAGVELASGLRYDDAASGLWLEARGRVLVLHSEDDDYEEQGFSLSAGLQPYRDGTGLSLSVAPRWGGSAAGTAAMLSPEGPGLYSRSIAAQRRRGSLHTALSYGFATPETGGVTTPFAQFDVTDGAGYRAKLGTRYQLSAGANTLKLELSSDLTTRPTHAVVAAAADDSPAHEIWLTAALQGRPFTSSDGRRRRAGRILAQADSVDSTTTNPQPAEAAEDTVEIEEIRVTGSRFQRSLSDALDEKRRADEIIEALSAEDIGALPDTSVAESLAKLPGVSYTRNAFGANNLSIRGLGAVLTNGTLNGRDLASEWGDRSVSFNMFPAELIARASLYKAPAASHVEGGIGGTLNLRTARALEWGERYVVANVRGRYNDLAGDLPDSEEFGYRGSVAYLDQFANDTVGIAIGYAGQYAPLVGADSQIYESRTVGFGGAIDGIPAGVGATNDFNIPYGAEYSFFSGASERHSVLGAIQWQPVENFEINIDAFFSAFEQSNSGAGLRLAGGLGSFGNRWSNVQTDGFNVAGATVACLHDEQPNNCADRGWGQDLGAFNARDDGDSTLHSYGIEGQWSAGALTLVYDFSWSKAEGEDAYTTVGYRPYNGMPDALELVRPVATFGENDAGAAFLTSPLDFTDLATNRIDALRLIENEREDEIFTYKFDAEYAVDYPFLTAFKAGIRLVNRDNLLVRRDARLDPSPATIAAAVAINPDFVFGVYDQSQAASAFDGNPLLRPYIANQFDLSVERYFDEDTALALAFFYKDMDTFITQARIVSGPPDERVTSFIAANGAGGHILGVEATAQHTFTGLLPEGYGDIGIYATYTWTDSNVELSETFNSGTFGLDGQSEHLGNLTLHYHRHKLGARISYRYRSEFTRPQRPARAFTINRAEGDLSFQVSYDMNTQLRLFVEGWNLLDEPRDNYHGLKSLQGQYTQFGRNIQLGVSYRF